MTGPPVVSVNHNDVFRARIDESKLMTDHIRKKKLQVEALSSDVKKLEQDIQSKQQELERLSQAYTSLHLDFDEKQKLVHHLSLIESNVSENQEMLKKQFSQIYQNEKMLKNQTRELINNKKVIEIYKESKKSLDQMRFLLGEYTIINACYLDIEEEVSEIDRKRKEISPAPPPPPQSHSQQRRLTETEAEVEEDEESHTHSRKKVNTSPEPSSHKPDSIQSLDHVDHVNHVDSQNPMDLNFVIDEEDDLALDNVTRLKDIDWVGFCISALHKHPERSVTGWVALYREFSKLCNLGSKSSLNRYITKHFQNQCKTKWRIGGELFRLKRRSSSIKTHDVYYIEKV